MSTTNRHGANTADGVMQPHGANTADGVMQPRVVVEVADVDTTTTRMIDAGAEPVAQPTETPWRSRNSRLDPPGPVHLTLFQELDNGARP